MNRSQPLVSVITATHNAAGTVRACLESVRTQDYPYIQHVVMDGASTDGTVEILRESGAKGLLWISEPDRGIYDAWNKSLSIATGEWIAFLGADDVLLPTAVSSYMRFAAVHPHAEYLSSVVRWVGPTGRQRMIGEAWSWPRFQRYMCTAHPGSMHRRTLFERYGQYDSSLHVVADYEFLLRSGRSLQAAFLPEVTVQMQGGGNSDNVIALSEAAGVKIRTGKRNPWLTKLELLAARQKFRLRAHLSKMGLA